MIIALILLRIFHSNISISGSPSVENNKWYLNTKMFLKLIKFYLPYSNTKTTLATRCITFMRCVALS